MIEAKDLTKTYETYRKGSGFRENIKSFLHREKILVHAVDHVNFTIEEGDICGILGPNGAGKSTTIKMLCGTLFASSGTVQVMGFNPAKDRQRYVQQIGAVFGQKSQLIWDIPPIDSFRMNKAIYGVSEQDYKRRLEEFATEFGVTEVMYKPTRVLSLGERMKCEFIMAMLHEPKVVFLDEPTIGLDVFAKKTIREFVAERNRKGTTFILTTHDLEDVEQLAKRTIIINHGKKVFDDSIEHLRLTLGAKKLIDFSLSSPIADYTAITRIPGVKVLGVGEQGTQSSQYQLSLEMDMEQNGIHNLLQEMSKLISFSDVTIKELPMETIITEIYTES